MVLNWAIFLGGIGYLTYAVASAMAGQEIFLFGDGGLFLRYAEHGTLVRLYFGLIALCTLFAGIFVVGSLVPETEFGRMTRSLWAWLEKLPGR
ncbi:hypothetical protein [Neorhizobium galegae]|uniref:Uncharacterized protein n=2 Tax=Neorhizobium galegae TaxID=399 RepID=A0A068STP4_NEOGA|nr:hypothetical protein [Neorhizobium galegae]KAB1087819.1 hypothetical protein F4V91_16125 [Neorhizobium galegae]MCQ1850398.1 hypothetical protein [Neorhizobium galegae]CDN49136.1 Hypothetical protein RG540_CH29710 [Neorhizobium galegae bv. orientalis str. HAMBI 540]